MKVGTHKNVSTEKIRDIVKLIILMGWWVFWVRPYYLVTYGSTPTTDLSTRDGPFDPPSSSPRWRTTKEFVLIFGETENQQQRYLSSLCQRFPGSILYPFVFEIKGENWHPGFRLLFSTLPIHNLEDRHWTSSHGITWRVCWLLFFVSSSQSPHLRHHSPLYSGVFTSATKVNEVVLDLSFSLS